jgi:hypothetical protein
MAEQYLMIEYSRTEGCFHTSVHWDSTNVTNFSIFSSDTLGEYGGMAIPPVTSVQLPLPPAFTFAIRRALASGSPL